MEELEAQANRTRFRKQIDIRTLGATFGSPSEARDLVGGP